MTDERSAAPSPAAPAHPSEPWSAQVRRLMPALLAVVALVGLVALALVVLGHVKHVELPDLTRDPSAVTHTHFYIGALSFLGFAAWGIGAGAALVGGLAQTRGSATRRMLLQVAAITTYLLLDDMLLFHEEVLPDLGVPERVIYPGYFVITVLWVWFNRAAIARTEWVLLLAALAGFGGSVALDILTPDISSWTFVEDCAKFGGIVFWSLYLVRTAVRSVRPADTSVAA